jgi:hypothetical protein
LMKSKQNPKPNQTAMLFLKHELASHIPAMPLSF